MTKPKKVSKSQFERRVLEYFAEVERTGQALIITDHGKPVVKIVPCVVDPMSALADLRGTVIRYDDPTEPVTFE